MDDNDRAKIKNIKSKVLAMLQERHTLENHPHEKLLNDNQTSIADPSKYWSDVCSFFDYMLGLSEESFAKLRLHTYHLTGDNYQLYYYGDPEVFLTSSNLEVTTKGLPLHFIINEPASGIGFHYAKGRFLSLDILRYQQALSTFYRYSVIPETPGADTERRYVLEPGGGYGGLAHHFSNIYKNVVYFIVDLPEVLLFSASYLSLLNPQKKIYLYEKEGFQELLQSKDLGHFDFVLLPNYILESLTQLRFDLVINQSAFQEMRTRQVEKYLDFIKNTCKGVLYSWNRDHQPRNEELSNLTDLLKQRFDLIEVLDWQQNQEKPKTEHRQSLKLTLRKFLKAAAIYTGLLEKPNKMGSETPAIPIPPYHEYICRRLSPPTEMNMRQE
jgi:hypothetical protein